MRIGLFVPCYRGQVRLEHMRAHSRNREWAIANGHEVGDLDAQTCHIDVSRNAALAMALRHECDRLLMMDADCAVPQSHCALEHLMARMNETGAAVVGSVVLRRGGEPNVFDEGQSVGTGLMLLDLRQLARFEPPWFQPRYTPDGADLAASGDIAFCRLARARGLRVVVDDRLPTLHVGEMHHQFSSPAAAMPGSRDGAP